MNKKKIAVLMGGVSPEHEISLISGKQVCLHADTSKFEIIPIVISQTGQWRRMAYEDVAGFPDPIRDKVKVASYLQKHSKPVQLDFLKKQDIAVVFIALHGPGGEDGSIQGLLQSMNIAYTGPGVLASAIGMDKLRFRFLCQSQNIAIPEFIAVSKSELGLDISKKLGKPPYFVKPSDQGSSVGMSLVRKKSDLQKALEKAWKYSQIALVDKFVQGTEVTAAVLGNKNPKVLPLIEIRPQKGDFFNYESKYFDSGAQEICPAQINKPLMNKVGKIALEVYKLVGATGFSRVDFIIDKEKNPVVLEINTIPGLTPMSLFPKAAKQAGIAYQDLITQIIDYARN